MATKEFTDEELNYFRVCYVITRIVPEGLRTVFKREWDTRYTTSHGQWRDITTNADDFKSMESARSRNRNARSLNIMKNGNTNEWDCTCLFYTLLYSDCLGPFLNTTVRTNVDELREIRNEVAHNAYGSLTDIDFQDSMERILGAFMALELDSTQVSEMKTQKTFSTKELSSIQQQLDAERIRYAKLCSFHVLPPKPSHDTTDRKEEVTTIIQEMEKLRNAKKNEVTVIYLSGNPGCGKSELARQVADKYFNEMSADTAELKFIFTFDASSIDSLLKSYADFAARLSWEDSEISRIIALNGSTSEDKIEMIRSLVDWKVRTYSSWLIIVDNVTDLKLISKYLPRAGEKTSGDGQILVTTQDCLSIPRDSHTYHYSSLKLGMKENDAVNLLYQISGCLSDKDLALKIAKALDFQPLALACAAIYMQEIRHHSSGQSDSNWNKYLDKLETGKRQATESVYMEKSLTYSSTMTSAVMMALTKVERDDGIMLHAFQFLSTIANEPIPLKYAVQYVMKHMPEDDPERVALHIRSSSLVISFKDLDDTEEIRLHQVVYGCLQNLFSKANETDYLDILKVMSVFSDLVSFENLYDVTKEDVNATRLFVPHFVKMSTKLEHYIEQNQSQAEESLDATNCLFKAGSICFVHGSYKASEIYLQICLSIQEAAYDKFKRPRMSLSQIFKLFTTYVEHQNNHLGRDLAITLKCLGNLHIKQLDQKTAKVYLERALAIEEKVYCGNRPEIVITLKGLGFCLVKLRQHEEARACLERALEIQEKTGEASPLLFDILKNLVLLFEDKGEVEKANQYCERLLAHEDQILCGNNPHLCDTINDLGNCLWRLNKLREAKRFYEKALEIAEKAYHANHPYLTIVIHNFGVFLFQLKQYEEAKTYLERAVEIHDRNAQYGLKSSLLPDTLFILGRCLVELKQYEKAKTCLRRSLAILENADGENDPRLAAVKPDKIKQYLKYLEQC